jgi:hypothetical protein
MENKYHDHCLVQLDYRYVMVLSLIVFSEFIYFYYYFSQMSW